MSDEELLGAVRALREVGHSPKQIARALGVRQAVVAPLVRAIAAERVATAGEPALLGCWVSPGWSHGLSVEDRLEWPDVDVRDADANEASLSGLVGVLVAREQRRDKVSVCGYLVDACHRGLDQGRKRTLVKEPL